MRKCSCPYATAGGVSFLNVANAIKWNGWRRNGVNMAAYMRSVKCLVAIERQCFATKGRGLVVETRRYVRGLRRKPVRVLFPDSEPDKVLRTTPQSQPVVQTFKNKKDVKHEAPLRRHTESEFVKARSHVTSSISDPHVTDRKDEIDGLHFERALPGDKRLG